MAEPRPMGQKEAPPAMNPPDDREKDTTSVYGAGYGSAGYGSNSSLDHVRAYPENGLVPTGDGTLTYPSDVVVEQAANLAPITAFNANTALGKRDKAQQMYDESDKAAEAITKAKARMLRENSDWQTQRQKMLSSLRAIAANSGTGQSGSYWKNVMQDYRLADDIMDVKALDAKKKALNETYIDEAETKQQNQNARNELDIDTWSSLEALKSDFAAQLSSLNPSLASGVYGSEQNKSWNDETPEDERPSIFPYEDKAGSTKPEDLYKVGSRLAEQNGQEANYRFLPIIDREGHTIIAPPWFPEFNWKLYEAITPQREPMVRKKAHETTTLRNAGYTGRTKENSSASLMKDLAPYVAGYNNRSSK